VDPRTIVVGRNSCDSAKFPFYERLENGDGPTLLFVGQLIKRKGVLQMIKALDHVTDVPWRLKVAGTGPLMSELERWAGQPRYAGRVDFLGYVQQERMSYVFRSADILLFPSLRDVYPLVILEALLNGLYIVGSDRSAVSFDMLKPGISGDIAPPGDPVGFGAAIRKALMSLPYDRKRIRSTVEHITPEREAANMFEAVEIALNATASSSNSAHAGTILSNGLGVRQ
jgi:glycosyltransferase involved in cell wall biosynthesis